MSQLLRAGYKITANQMFEDIVVHLKDIPDPVYEEAARKMTFGKDTCDVFEKVLQDQLAMLDELSTIQFEIQKTCRHHNHHIIKWLRIGRHGLWTTGHAWPLQKGAPYRIGFNYYMTLILSGGHFKKWTNDATMIYKKNMIWKSREAVYKKFRSLNFKRFCPLLAIYFVGIAVAGFIFICEIIYFNIMRYFKT